MNWLIIFGLGMMAGLVLAWIDRSVRKSMKEREYRRQDKERIERETAIAEKNRLTHKELAAYAEAVLKNAPEIDYGYWEGVDVCESCKEEIGVATGRGGICPYCGNYSGTKVVDCITKVRRRVSSEPDVSRGQIVYRKKTWEYKEEA